MLYQYVPDPVKWSKVEAEVLINTYGEPHEQRYSYDDTPVTDVLQDLLDLNDREFMLEHTRQGKDGILLVDKEFIGYFENLITQSMYAEDLCSEIDRLHVKAGSDLEVYTFWDAHRERISVIEETSGMLQEQPADTMQVINTARSKYLKSLKNYLDNRE